MVEDVDHVELDGSSKAVLPFRRSYAALDNTPELEVAQLQKDLQRTFAATTVISRNLRGVRCVGSDLTVQSISAAHHDKPARTRKPGLFQHRDVGGISRQDDRSKVAAA